MIKLVFLKVLKWLKRVYYLPLLVCFRQSGSKFPLSVCNFGYDALMMSLELSSFAILNIHSAAYCCIDYELAKPKP